MINRGVFAVVLILGTFQQQLLAWSSAGHEVIAAGTWHELPASTKARVTELLKSHPDYGKWKQAFDVSGTGLDLPTFAFMRASRWPDEIRRHGNSYDHPHWHYVDWPLSPPSFAIGEEPAKNDNVLYGIRQCKTVLGDNNASAEERAAYLSWLIHLVGDIHQPLHTVSWFGGQFTEGDKGGNIFFVKPASRGINLHSLWDGLLGTSGKPQAHVNYAIQILAEHSRKSLGEIEEHKTPNKWSLEGRSIAIDRAYLRGELKGGTSSDTARALPDGYTKAAKTVAEKQGALAAYRLGDEIVTALGR